MIDVALLFWMSARDFVFDTAKKKKYFLVRVFFYHFLKMSATLDFKRFHRRARYLLTKWKVSTKNKQIYDLEVEQYFDDRMTPSYFNM